MTHTADDMHDDSPVTRDKAIEIIRSVAYTTALKHREEGRRVLADQIDAALAATAPSPVTPAPVGEVLLCEDCPPVGYPTDKTRCVSCPRRSPPSDTSGEAVAWRLKDYADGWTITTFPELVKRYREEIGGLVEPLYPASALAAAEARGVAIGLERAAKCLDLRADAAISTSMEYIIENDARAIRSLSPAHKGSEND